MKALLTVFSLTAVSLLVGATEPTKSAPAPWDRIRSLARDGSREGSARLFEHLESLTTEEMLTAARQACQEVEDEPQEHPDTPAWAVAETSVMLCLHHYFEKVDVSEGSQDLLEIVGSEREPSLLRRAIVAYTSGKPKTRFQHTFQTYAQAHRAEVYDMFLAILKDNRQDAALRDQVLESLGRQIGKQAGEIVESDDNVSEAVQEKRRHTDRAVFVNELIRTDDIPFTGETLEKLKPVEAQALTYIRILGKIVADHKNEPEGLRKHAKRRLEGFRRSVLSGMDAEVQKALQQPVD